MGCADESRVHISVRYPETNRAPLRLSGFVMPTAVESNTDQQSAVRLLAAICAAAAPVADAEFGNGVVVRDPSAQRHAPQP